mgnify:CR=1 FL=1
MSKETEEKSLKKYDPNKKNGGYTPFQLNERIRGKTIAQEFDFPNDILQNQRERSLQTGELHGCECFVDGDINLYYRKDFVCYVQQREWKPGKVIEKPSDTSDSSDKKPDLKVVR